MLSTYFIITIKVIFLNQCTIICPICSSLICSAWFHQFWRSLWTNVGIIIMLYNKPDYIFLVDYWLSNEEYLEAWEWSLAMSWWIVCLLSSWKLDQNLVLIRYLLLWSDSEDVFSCEKLSEHHLVESKSIVMIGTYLLCTRK